MFSKKKGTVKKEDDFQIQDLESAAPAENAASSRKDKKKLPAWIILPILAAILLLLWIVSLFAGGAGQEPGGTALTVVKAEKGTVKEVYNSTGTIESGNTKTYYSPVTAPIKECKAVVG